MLVIMETQTKLLLLMLLWLPFTFISLHPTIAVAIAIVVATMLTTAIYHIHWYCITSINNVTSLSFFMVFSIWKLLGTRSSSHILRDISEWTLIPDEAQNVLAWFCFRPVQALIPIETTCSQWWLVMRRSRFTYEGLESLWEAVLSMRVT